MRAPINAIQKEVYCAVTTGEYTSAKMNTIVFNKLSSQVLFEEKAKEAEMSSRNYLEVMDGQHPDLLSSSQAMKDNAARHRRAGYVNHHIYTYLSNAMTYFFCPPLKVWKLPLRIR